MAYLEKYRNYNKFKFLTSTSLVILLVPFCLCVQVILAAAPSPENPADSTNPVQTHSKSVYSGYRSRNSPYINNGNGSPTTSSGSSSSSSGSSSSTSHINTNSDSSSDTSELPITGEYTRGHGNGSNSTSSSSLTTSSSVSQQHPSSSSLAPGQQQQQQGTNHGPLASAGLGPGNSSMTGGGPYPGSSGPLCSEKSGCRRGTGIDMKRLSLQMIRHDILRKLRMDENRLPNITGKGFPIPPDYINEFIDMQSDSPRDDYDDEHATTEKIIAFSRIQQLKISPKESRGVYYFTFSDKLSNMKVEKALLYIHVRTVQQIHHAYPYNEKKFFNFTIRLMEFVPQKKGESPLSINYGFFKPTFRSAGDGHGSVHGHVRHSRSKWVQIDVRDALTKWLAGTAPSASKRIGLVIEAIDPNGQDVSQDVTIVSSNEMDVNSNPFIEVHVSDKGKSRPPRNIGMTCDENSQETRCCRYPLTVDFEDFGWDWIIAPKKYDANYCSGECPYAFLQKYPHNHIVQQAIPTGVGGPCCAARKMSSISMLYFDSDSNIVFSVLPGMVVDKCGCS